MKTHIFTIRTGYKTLPIKKENYKNNRIDFNTKYHAITFQILLAIVYVILNCIAADAVLDEDKMQSNIVFMKSTRINYM